MLFGPMVTRILLLSHSFASSGCSGRKTCWGSPALLGLSSGPSGLTTFEWSITRPVLRSGTRWKRLAKRFYPELESRLGELERLTIPAVGNVGNEGREPTLQLFLRQAHCETSSTCCRLPEHVTMTACRHGGMTELGDAELTEQGA